MVLAWPNPGVYPCVTVKDASLAIVNLHCELLHTVLYSEVPKMLHRRGQVCMIPGTKEFFIALVDHDEWGGAHTVWGEVSTSLPGTHVR